MDGDIGQIVKDLAMQYGTRQAFNGKYLGKWVLKYEDFEIVHEWDDGVKISEVHQGNEMLYCDRRRKGVVIIEFHMDKGAWEHKLNIDYFFRQTELMLEKF